MENLPNPHLTLPQGEDSEPGLKVLFQKSRLKQKFLRKPLGMGATSDSCTHYLCPVLIVGSLFIFIVGSLFIVRGVLL